MERLPTELLDHIVSYVKGRTTLTALRLVDNAFCRSASRRLFRRVVLRLGYRRSITKFEAISSSGYAPYVCKIAFNPQPFYAELRGFQYDFSAYDVANRLPSLLIRFPNLASVDIWLLELEQPETWLPWLPVVLESIANPQLHSLKRLQLPPDACGYLAEFLKDSSKTSVRQLMRQIQHLSFDSTDEQDPFLEGLDTLLQNATNLATLRIEGYFNVFDQFVEDIDRNQSLQLKFLELSRVNISSYELLGMLERCKDTIRKIKINYVTLSAGTWLHLLVQIKKNLKLFNFFLCGWNISLEGQTNLGDAWPEYGFFQRDHHLICHAVGDIQRQINLTRLAEGLRPWSKKTFQALPLPPLQSVMNNARYRELSSQPWDAEKDDSCHYDGDF